MSSLCKQVSGLYRFVTFFYCQYYKKHYNNLKRAIEINSTEVQLISVSWEEHHVLELFKAKWWSALCK
jgi:hypothetical protein